MGLKMQSFGRIRSQLRWKVQFMGKKTYVQGGKEIHCIFVVPSTMCHLLLAILGKTAPSSGFIIIIIIVIYNNRKKC